MYLLNAKEYSLNIFHIFQVHAGLCVSFHAKYLVGQFKKIICISP